MVVRLTREERQRIAANPRSKQDGECVQGEAGSTHRKAQRRGGQRRCRLTNSSRARSAAG